MRALSLRDVAAELGRSPGWLAHHWPSLVAERGLPKPIHEKGGLVWSAPAVHAWLVRELPPELRAIAAAYRAAHTAAVAPPDDEIEIWRQHLHAGLPARETP